jgi:hypothetical protein
MSGSSVADLSEHCVSIANATGTCHVPPALAPIKRYPLTTVSAMHAPRRPSGLGAPYITSGLMFHLRMDFGKAVGMANHDKAK